MLQSLAASIFRTVDMGAPPSKMGLESGFCSDPVEEKASLKGFMCSKMMDGVVSGL